MENDSLRSDSYRNRSSSVAQGKNGKWENGEIRVGRCRKTEVRSMEYGVWSMEYSIRNKKFKEVTSNKKPVAASL
jgi:hypothetical protein